jgi:UPF0176 protein
VFDNRVSVNHALQKGSYDQCHACRLPITETDRQSEKYHQGVSCPACFDSSTESQRKRFVEREKQVQLANMRGETHIGSSVIDTNRLRKNRKLAAKNQQRAT